MEQTPRRAQAGGALAGAASAPSDAWGGKSRSGGLFRGERSDGFLSSFLAPVKGEKKRKKKKKEEKVKRMSLALSIFHFSTDGDEERKRGRKNDSSSSSASFALFLSLIFSAPRPDGSDAPPAVQRRPRRQVLGHGQRDGE